MRIVNMGEVSKEILSKKCNKTQKLERDVYFFFCKASCLLKHPL